MLKVLLAVAMSGVFAFAADLEKDVRVASQVSDAELQVANDTLKKHEKLTSGYDSAARDAETKLQQAEAAAERAAASLYAMQKRQAQIGKEIAAASKLQGYFESDAAYKKRQADLGGLRSQSKTIGDELVFAEKAHSDAASAQASALTKLADAQKILADNKAILDKANADIKTFTKRSDQERRDARAEIAALRRDIRANGLNRRVQDLKFQQLGLETVQTILEEEANNSALGEYMKKKMEGLLVNQTFCTFANICANPKGNTGGQKPDLSNLFSSVARDRNAGAKQADGADGETHP